MTNKGFHYFLFFLFLSWPLGSAATPNLSIRGFGSAAGQKVGTQLNVTDLGNSGSKLDLLSLSRFGLNLHSDLSDRFSVTSQLLAYNAQDNFSLDLDWGFLSWKPSPALAIRAGRLISPVWLYSQQIDVGYTYPWVRLPVEVYGLNNVKAINGISVLAERRLGVGILQAEILSGSSRNGLEQKTRGAESEFDTIIRNFVGADLRFLWEDYLTIRAAYNQADVNVQVDNRLNLPAGVITGVNVPTFVAVPTVLDANRARFLSLGVKSEFENFFFVTEFARRWIRGNALARASGFYGSLGRNFGPISIYGLYAWRGDLQGNLRPHPLSPAVTTLLLKMVSWGGGINYQVHENVILKSELLRSHYSYQDPARSFSFYNLLFSADFIF